MPDDMLFDEQEGQDKPSTSKEDPKDGERPVKRGKPRALWLRWKALTIGNQIIVVSTVVIAAANIIYAVIAGWQLNEIRSSSVDTHNLALAARDQALAASRNAEAAIGQSTATGKIAAATEKAVIDARQSFIIEMQPYVASKRVAIRNFAVGKRFEVGSDFTNFGRTPALNVVIAGRLETYRNDGGPIRPRNTAYDLSNASKGTLGGNSDQTISLTLFGPQTWSDVQYAAINDGKATLVVHGRVTYDDIFPDNPPRLTTFCWRFDFSRTKQMVSCAFGDDIR